MPKRNTLRLRQRGGLGAIYGKITGKNGKNYHNTNFSGKLNDPRGLDYQWQIINQKLDAHLKHYVDSPNLIHSGFGGNDRNGTVALRNRVSIPPLMFNLDGKNYVMSFENYEDGAYHANIRGNNNHVYHNTNFSGRKINDPRGTDYRWLLINNKLEEHLRQTLSESNIVQSGFGGNDRDGTVIVDREVEIPPMPFSIDGKEYVMKFERYEENN